MKRPHFFAGAAVVALASTFLGLPAAHAATVVPDPNFAACLNAALGNPVGTEITATMLEGGAGTIFCDSRGITNLEGAQFLTSLYGLHLRDNQISDLSWLAGLDNLRDLDLQGNTISDVNPLAGLSLWALNLAYNSITDPSPLSALTTLQYLDLSYNMFSGVPASLFAGMNEISNIKLEGDRISDVTPLAALASMPKLWALYLNNNQISNVAPLAALTGLHELYLNSNLISDPSPLGSLTNLFGLGLDANSIKDITSLTSIIKNNILATGGGRFAALGQQVTLPSVAVGTYPLPILADTTVLLSRQFTVVPSGAQTATIDTTANTITYQAPGVYKIDWLIATPSLAQFSGTFTITVTGTPVVPVTVTFDPQGGTVSTSTASTTTGGTVTLPAAPTLTGKTFGGWYTAVNGGGTVFTASTPVTGDMTVFAYWVVPASSTVVLPPNTGVATGGAARLATGSDSYSVKITIEDSASQIITGLSSVLTPILPPGVKSGQFTQNADGTYSLPVMSGTPGIYRVGVMLNNVPIDAFVTVNFIGAQITVPSLQVGATQTVKGLGFMPGENVKVTAHSTPLLLGTFVADSSGVVTVPSFAVPADFAVGTHTVDFEGLGSGELQGSGKVTVPFQVVAPGSASARNASTGGSLVVSSLPAALTVVILLALVAGLSVGVVRYRRAA